MVFNNQYTTSSIFRHLNPNQVNIIRSDAFTKNNEWKIIHTHYIDLHEVFIYLKNALAGVGGLFVKDDSLFYLAVNMVELVVCDRREQAEDLSDAFLALMESPEEVEVFNNNLEEIGEISDRSFAYVRSHMTNLFGAAYLDYYSSYQCYFWHFARRVGQFQAQFNILEELSK